MASYPAAVAGFEHNEGQTDPRVEFVLRGPGYGLFLTPDEVVLRVSGRPPPTAHPERATSGRDAVVRMRLPGANQKPKISGLGPLLGTTNYFLGDDPDRWTKGVRRYARVRYHAIHPGIDLVFHADRGRLEYDFVVEPGADPSAIAVAFAGADSVSIDADGALVLGTAVGPIAQPRPFVYQEVDGRQAEISGGYLVDEAGTVGFQLGAFDRTRPLVIDPVLPYSTYLGGTGDDGVDGVAFDSEGNAYLTGWTTSVDFPTENPGQGGYAGEDPGSAVFCSRERESVGQGCGDAFVTKLDRSGSAVVYSTYIGGTSSDSGYGIAVDRSGAAYVAGVTKSSDFPAGNRLAPSQGVRFFDQGFVAKLDPSGSKMVYSTTLGGESATGVAVDSAGSAYVTGSATVAVLAAGMLDNGFQPRPGGIKDAYVAKLDPGGSGVVYATYLGGPGPDSGDDIAIDPSGHAYVTGSTEPGGFPTKNAFRAAPGGGKDAFVAKIDPTATGADSLLYSTYLGGTGSDAGNGVAVDSSGAAYVTGRTESPDFPTRRAFQKTRAGRVNAFLAKVVPAGTGVAYSTYLGRDEDEANDVAVDGSGNAYVTGTTRGKLPVKDAFQRPGGGQDAFVAKIGTARSGPDSLEYSTYLGGAGDDSGKAIAVDRSGRAYVGGYTGSHEGFPGIVPFQARWAGERDGFVAKVAPRNPEAPFVTGVEPPNGPTSGGTRVVITGHRLDDVVAVRFGGTEALRRRVSSDGKRLTVLSPARSEGGPAVVTVTTDRGTSGPVPASKFVYGAGAWSRTRGVARFNHAAVQLPNGKLLVAGGCLTGSSTGACTTSADDAHIYDPARRVWAHAGKMSAPRPAPGGSRVTATALPNGKVLVVGARSADLYDPTTGNWAPTAAPESIAVDFTATLLPNGKVLFVDGRTGGVELYDSAAGTWSSSAAPKSPISRAYHTATLLQNGKVLVAGGDASELYDPSSDSFSPIPEMAIPRAYHTATLLPDGKVLMVGGRNDSADPTASVEIFDPEAVAEAQPPPCSECPAVAAGTKGDWRAARGLPFPRYAHTATLLPSGKVLVAGGSYEYGSRLAAAELYDVSTERWEAAADMGTPRGSAIPEGGGTTASGRPAAAERPQGGSTFTSTLLKDGTVLVVGGGAPPSSASSPNRAAASTTTTTTASVPTGASALASAEVYDPDPDPATLPEEGGGSRALVGAAIAVVALVVGAVILVRSRRRGQPSRV